MAASGINEHHEALRKQNVINRQVYLKKMMLEKFGQKSDANSQLLETDLKPKMDSSPGYLGPLSSYDLENLCKKYDVAETDQRRRNALRQQQYLTYSAKINGRLTSTDYIQQW